MKFEILAESKTVNFEVGDLVLCDNGTENRVYIVTRHGLVNIENGCFYDVAQTAAQSIKSLEQTDYEIKVISAKKFELDIKVKIIK